MGLNIKDLRKQRAAIKERQGGGDYFKPGTGTNRVRLALWDSAVLGGKTVYFRERKLHQQRGAPPVACDRSPARTGEIRGECVRCDHYSEVYEQEGRDPASGYKAKTRFEFVVVPIEKGDKPFGKPRLLTWSAAQTIGTAIVDLIADGDECENPNEVPSFFPVDLA